MALTPEQVTAKLDELEKLVASTVAEKRVQLELERKLLELVLKTQGFTSVTRLSSNQDKIRSLAKASELLPVEP